jgi:hypothetical protein
MTAEEELLLEQVIGAHRERGVDGSIRSHPAWHDLSEQARAEAFDATLVSRQLEVGLDALGRSTTVRAVLARIRRG